MPSPLLEQIAQENEAIKKAGKWKEFRLLESPMDTHVQMEGRGDVLVLSSNNYLGLASHPEVIAAGKAALDTYGAGTASVRFICGYFGVHKQLENKLASLHRTDAALSYVSCWSANTGVLPTITGEGDVLISDALNHASLIDGCRASKGKRMVYAHSNMDELKAKLEEAKGARRILVVTDGVFSMEGDIAKLPDILTLCRQYNATLMMDDCHGVGVMGKHGRGTAEHFGVEGEVDIITGTLGKALGGAAGGYVAAPQAVVDFLNQNSRPQLFSNALPATVAGSALKAIEVLEREPQRVGRIHQLAQYMRGKLVAAGFTVLESESGILAVIVGETAKAIRMSGALLDEANIFITGFGFPVVPEGAARLRLQMCASLTEAELDRAVAAFITVRAKLGE